jgi:hypothetical protein
MKDFLLRYPAAVLLGLSTLLQMLVAFGLDLSDGETAAINAIAAAVFGVATAIVLAHDRLLPAILGFGQALATLIIAFGGQLTDAQVKTALDLLAAIATPLILGFVHKQATAAVDVHGNRVPRKGMFRLAA